MPFRIAAPMHRYRWLLAAAFAASAIIFGVAYNPSAAPAPPRPVPSFNVAHHYVTAAVKGLRGSVLARRFGAAGSFGLPRAGANTELSRQAATLTRSFAPVTAALQRAGLQN